MIDRQEAQQFIFESVREPSEQEEQVAVELHQMRQANDDQETFIYNFTKTCLETENEQKTKTRQNDEKNTS